MKKNIFRKRNKIFALFYGVAIMVFFLANSSIAQTRIEIKNPIRARDFMDILENTMLWLLEVSGSLALLMLIVGGVMYITSGGDEQKVANSKKIFNFTIIGLVIILISYALIKVINEIFNVW